jgi:hypothetical protein
MRIDLPQELPRRRAPEAPPLEPSPVERRREDLANRAREHLGPKVASQRREHALSHRPPREPRQRTVEHEQPRDRRPRRNDLPNQMIGLSLRKEERKLLAEVGRFRVIGTRDLTETVYDNRLSRMERDLAFLRESIEVVTLTRAGRDAARQISGLPQDQKLYAGLVKARRSNTTRRSTVPIAKRQIALSRRVERISACSSTLN